MRLCATARTGSARSPSLCSGIDLRGQWHGLCRTAISGFSRSSTRPQSAWTVPGRANPGCRDGGGPVRPYSCSVAGGPTESETCRELILPALRDAGWSDDQIVEEFRITDGRIVPVGSRHRRERPLRADYALDIDGVPVAVVEAKRTKRNTADGIGQAKVYAQLLDLPLAYASNGIVNVRVDLANGREDFNARFPTPDEAWAHFREAKGLTDGTARAYTEPFDRDLRLSDGRVKTPRYYQRTAANRTVERVLRGDRRLLVVMATGTGKSFLAMQIVWKLQKSGWIDGRRPRVLYLADRNILIDQPRLREFVPVFGENAIHKFAGEMKTGRGASISGSIRTSEPARTTGTENTRPTTSMPSSSTSAIVGARPPTPRGARFSSTSSRQRRSASPQHRWSVRMQTPINTSVRRSSSTRSRKASTTAFWRRTPFAEWC